MKRKNQWFDLSIDVHRFQVVEIDQDGRYQHSSCGELEVSKPR